MFQLFCEMELRSFFWMKQSDPAADSNFESHFNVMVLWVAVSWTVSLYLLQTHLICYIHSSTFCQGLLSLRVAHSHIADFHCCFLLAWTWNTSDLKKCDTTKGAQLLKRRSCNYTHLFGVTNRSFKVPFCCSFYIIKQHLNLKKQQQHNYVAERMHKHFCVHFVKN